MKVGFIMKLYKLHPIPAYEEYDPFKKKKYLLSNNISKKSRFKKC